MNLLTVHLQSIFTPLLARHRSTSKRLERLSHPPPAPCGSLPKQGGNFVPRIIPKNLGALHRYANTCQNVVSEQDLHAPGGEGLVSKSGVCRGCRGCTRQYNSIQILSSHVISDLLSLCDRTVTVGPSRATRAEADCYILHFSHFTIHILSITWPLSRVRILSVSDTHLFNFRSCLM